MRILLVDDEVVVNRSLGDFLRDRGHEVTYCDSPVAAIDRFRRDDFALVITDLRMPGMNGIDLIGEIKSISPDAGVIVITGHGDIEFAIAALRAGAADFLRKPIDLSELLIVIERVSNLRRLCISNQVLSEEIRRSRHSGASTESALVGESHPLADVRAMIGRIAAQPWSTVLVRGESGTGKELAARMLHDLGTLRDSPFIAVNCSAITPSLAESELFGHEKGAFTGAVRMHKGLIELADGGTLFLDEIGDLPLELQARLLRVLEEKAIRRVGGERVIPVAFRLISATNRDLERMTESGAFRKDLMFRINVVTLRMPALRNRLEDIPLLAEHLLKELRVRYARPDLRLTDESVEALSSLSFPGNVRELRNMVEQAVLISSDDALSPGMFPALNQSPAIALPAGSLNLRTQEETAIREALENANGNAREAAVLLGIGYGALRYRMSRLGI